MHCFITRCQICAIHDDNQAQIFSFTYNKTAEKGEGATVENALHIWAVAAAVEFASLG